MSNIGVKGEQSTSTETELLATLNALAAGGAGTALQKTTATTFSNVPTEAQFTTAEVTFLSTIADRTYTNGQLLIGNGAGLSVGTLTAGSGISITNASGSITIATVGAGTVTTVSISPNQGITGSVANAFTTPAITLSLGALTGVTSFNGLIVTANTGTITTGTWNGSIIDVAHGGTNASTASITSFNNITGYTATGATGTTSTNLVFSTSPVLVTPVLGAATGTSLQLSGLTASQIVITDASKNLVSAAVATYPSLTELSYVKGITSAVQTQMDLKAPIASPTFTGIPAAPTPTAGDSTTQIATTAFVQQAVRSVPSKEASKYATIAALPANTYNNGTSGVGATLTGVAVGALSVDGVAVGLGDRILIKNEVTTANNGIYTVTTLGTALVVYVLTRATDFNQSIDIKTGASTYVTSGNTLAGTTWDVSSADSPVMGTDIITFVQSAGPGSIIAGTGISISGSTVSIDTAVTVDKTTAQTLTNKTLTSPTLTTPALGTPSSGTLTSCTGLPVASVVGDTSTALGVGTIELGHATDTTLSRSAAGVLAVEGVVIPSISSTNTLTNKRVTKRAPAITQSATPTINTDNTDVAHITALAQAITSMTTNLSGTPVEGDTLRIDITDNGTARAITWGASFEASGTVALPTTTVVSVRLDVGFFWNSVSSKWRCVASS